MKDRIFYFVVSLVIAFSFITAFTYGQDSTSVVDGIDMAEQFGFSQYFTNVAGLGVLVVLISQLLKDKVLNKYIWKGDDSEAPDWVSWLLSIIVGVVLAFVGSFYEVGMFANEKDVFDLITMGVGVGLMSTGIFKMPGAKTTINVVKLNKHKKVV